MSILLYGFVKITERVTIGSMQHVLPILFAVILTIFLIWFANNKLLKKQKENLFQVMGYFVSVTVVFFHTYLISKGGYNITTDLPLFLCSLLALVIPVFTYYRKHWMYEVMLFWIIAGTTQGVVTPDIPFGYPNPDYFRYWIVHLGLLSIIFYATFVLKMRPEFKSVFKSIIALQGYMVFVFCVNAILDSNYSYLNEKPESASILDYLGEWPYYLIMVQLILIPLFLLIYLPFYLTRKKST
ncbi:MAG: TIGR02206 family membrane protein [Oceanihabitans sp.]